MNTGVTRENYLRRASKQFLVGTKHRTPLEAVEAGTRTLWEWADVLGHEREAMLKRERRANARVNKTTASI
jgi:hypothetical protein